jgi:hypothetical protein
MPERRELWVVVCVVLVAILVMPAPPAAAQSEAAAEPAIRLYRLPASAINAVPADTEVVISVEIDGATVATQRMSVVPEEPPRARLLEVLSGQPAAIADVERKVKAGRNAIVVVQVDGKQYQRINWKELLTPMQLGPGGTVAEPLAITSLTTEQQQCSARCDAEYDQCLRTCEPYSGPNACWDCRDQVQACGSFCSICPRTWNSYGSWTEKLPRMATGQYLCAAVPGAERMHQELRRTFKRTVTHFTERCDHSITYYTTTEEMSGGTCWIQIGGCRGATEFFNRTKCP